MSAGAQVAMHHHDISSHSTDFVSQVVYFSMEDITTACAHKRMINNLNAHILTYHNLPVCQMLNINAFQ